MPQPLPQPETLARPLGAVAIEPPPLALPLGGVRIRAGFPSPAEDFLDDWLDLNAHLIRNPAATYLYRAEGNSMLLAGICDGDILIVDRSVTPLNGDIVVATWDGNQPVCKVLVVGTTGIELHSRNPHHKPIVLPAEAEPEIFAVVGVARQMSRRTTRERHHARA